MEGPPLGPGGEDITWPDQVAPRCRKASSTRKIKPQTSNHIHWYTPSPQHTHQVHTRCTPGTHQVHILFRNKLSTHQSILPRHHRLSLTRISAATLLILGAPWWPSGLKKAKHSPFSIPTTMLFATYLSTSTLGPPKPISYFSTLYILFQCVSYSPYCSALINFVTS